MDLLTTKLSKVVFLLIVGASALCLSVASAVEASGETYVEQNPVGNYLYTANNVPQLGGQYDNLQTGGTNFCGVGGTHFGRYTGYKLVEGSETYYHTAEIITPFSNDYGYIYETYGPGVYMFDSTNVTGCSGVINGTLNSSIALVTITSSTTYTYQTKVNPVLGTVNADLAYQTRILGLTITSNSGTVSPHTETRSPTLEYTRVPGGDFPTTTPTIILTVSQGDVDETGVNNWDNCVSNGGCYVGIYLDGTSQEYADQCYAMSGSTETFTFTLENLYDGYDANEVNIVYGIESTCQIGTAVGYTTMTDQFLIDETPANVGISIEADYFLNTTEIITSISDKNPTSVQFELSKRPATTSNSQSESINNTVNGTSSVTTTFESLEDGTYDVLAKFSNAGCTLGLSQCPFQLTYVYSSFTVVGNEVTNVGTSEVYDNVVVAPSEEQYEDCGVSNIGGCINNSFRFLFIPSQSSINELIQTKDTLDTRIPFVYVTDIRKVADEIFNTAQAESLDVTLDLGFGTVPFINEDMIANAPQANLIRTLLSYMLWIAFAMGAYRMALGIHNKETT